MELKQTNLGEFFIIKLHKYIFTREHIDDLRGSINDIIAKDGKKIVLDLSEINRIDQIGLGVFLSIQKIAHFHNITVRFCNLQAGVQETFEQTRLDKVLDICKDSDQENDQDLSKIKALLESMAA